MCHSRLAAYDTIRIISARRATPREREAGRRPRRYAPHAPSKRFGGGGRTRKLRRLGYGVARVSTALVLGNVQQALHVIRAAYTR